jgi:hypothetical protein
MSASARAPIIVCMAATADRAAVLADIRTLAATGAPPLRQVEHTLTDGYACVLQIETERLRLERLLQQRAAGLAERSRSNAAEVAELAQGVARADEELAELRSALDALALVARRLRTA